MADVLEGKNTPTFFYLTALKPGGFRELQNVLPISPRTRFVPAEK